MERFYKTCVTVAVCAGLLIAWAQEGCCGEQRRMYVAAGPKSTASLEVALEKLLPCYAAGIWPAEDRLAEAMPARRIPKRYVVHLKTWLAKVLKDGVGPKPSLGQDDAFASDQWVLAPRLRFDCDFILGQFCCPDKTLQGKVQFQALTDHVTLGIESQAMFSLDPSEYDDTKVVTALQRVLDLPEASLSDMRVERHVAELGDNRVSVCYGKVRCRHDEFTSPEQNRDWWSYLPFWITKGRLCVDVSTTVWRKAEGPAHVERSTFQIEPEANPDVGSQPK